MGLRSKNREAIMAFKRECRSYFYYLADIRDLMLEIKRIDVKMAGVHAVDLTKVRVRRDPWKKPYRFLYVKPVRHWKNSCRKKKNK